MSEYESLLKEGQIVKVDPDPEAAAIMLRGAKRQHRAALKLISSVGDEGEMPEDAYAKAYSAGRTAIHALMTVEGYQINKDIGEKHVVTLNYGRLALGSEGEKWVNAVRNMRITRHNIEYGTREVAVPPRLAKARIRSVQELIDLVEERITGQSSMELQN